MATDVRSEKGTEKGLEQQLVHLVSHPVRVKALTVLADRIASPKEIAAELNENISTVSHHVKELLRMEMIELVDEKRRRGAVEHFYRAVMRPIWSTEAWEALSVGERNRVSIWTMQLILADAARALIDGTFDSRPERHATRFPLVVDEKGWKKVLQAQLDALETIYEAQTESSERLARSGKDGFPIVASMLSFPMPESDRK